jgi:hypothetical protein
VEQDGRHKRKVLESEGDGKWMRTQSKLSRRIKAFKTLKISSGKYSQTLSPFSLWPKIRPQCNQTSFNIQ